MKAKLIITLDIPERVAEEDIDSEDVLDTIQEGVNEYLWEIPTRHLKDWSIEREN